MLTPLQVWSEVRPAVHAAASRAPGPVQVIAWRLYWSVWLRLRYWSFYPVTNPRLTYLVCLAIAGVCIVVTGRRLRG